MKVSSLLLLAFLVLGVSCERHEFEGPDGTKQLHEHHGAGAHDDHAAGAHDDHAEHDEKAPAHGEKAAH